MTKSDKTTGENGTLTPPAADTGVDTGNGMSDRAGDYSASESGELDTATFYSVGIPDGSDLPANVLDPNGTKTIFGDGSAVPLDTSTEEDG